jgi:hypothetical protein
LTLVQTTRARVEIRKESYTGGFDAPFGAAFDGYSQLHGPSFQTGTVTGIGRDGRIFMVPLGFVSVESKTAAATFAAHAALCKGASVPMGDVMIRVLDKVSLELKPGGASSSRLLRPHS